MTVVGVAPATLMAPARAVSSSLLQLGDEDSGLNPAVVNDQPGFELPKRTTRARYVEQDLIKKSIISGSKRSASAAINDDDSSPSQVSFSNAAPLIISYTPEACKEGKRMRPYRTPVKKKKQRQLNFNRQVDGRSKEEAESYCLLEQWSKHYHALLHASRQAQNNCDEGGEHGPKWASAYDEAADMKDILLWTSSSAYLFNDRAYDPMSLLTVAIDLRWPVAEPHAKSTLQPSFFS